MATTATWPSASSRPLDAGPAVRPWVVLGVASSKRTREVHASCERQGWPVPRVVEWAQWLARPQALDAALAAPCVFKIEPPGDDPRVHHRLMCWGSQALGMRQPSVLLHGELAGGKAWFEGFRLAMQALADQLTRQPAAVVVNSPADIVAMTDKLECQQRLQAHGIETPRLFGPIGSHEELMLLLDHHGLDRVFVKARYGSSAAGVVAFRRNRRGQQQATTTARLVREGPDVRLFNVKRVSRYQRLDEVRQMLDLVCADGAYVEDWIPKPRCGAGHFDLRVLALRGQAAHRVARVSEHAMTNLHLDARREAPDRLLPAATIRGIEQIVSRAAAVFGHSQVIGFDVVPHRAGPRVLEANAFGDLLPGLLWQGRDPHAALVAAEWRSQPLQDGP